MAGWMGGQVVGEMSGCKERQVMDGWKERWIEIQMD